MQNDTPMMIQYKRAKAECPPGAILLFRIGDFYEMFGEDATEAAAILSLTLTKRNNLPMCGIPYHACELYLSKLVRAGKKCALCDQMEEPHAARRGIVRREITAVVGMDGEVSP